MVSAVAARDILQDIQNLMLCLKKLSQTRWVTRAYYFLLLTIVLIKLYWLHYWSHAIMFWRIV